jgi:hypothetical protein
MFVSYNFNKTKKRITMGNFLKTYGIPAVIVFFVALAALSVHQKWTSKWSVMQ